jgi:hypothetical protein
MRLRASIVIDMDVEDYIAAGQTQQRLQGVYETFLGHYPSATFRISERRTGRPRRSPASRRPVVLASGALHAYEDGE